MIENDQNGVQRKIGQRKVAVFDIDGTVFRSSLLIELVEKFVEEGLFPYQARALFTEEYQRWLARQGSYAEYLNKVAETYRTYIKGIKLADALEVSDRLMIFHKNRVYTFTRDLVKKLAKTHFLLAISHSPYHVVEPFCREWGFDKVYAMMYEVDENGAFTGNVEYEDLIKDKGKILERAVRKEKLTLRGSIGVGDTESDTPMLKMVSRSIAFNPNRKLYQAAKKNRWEIVVERKDVIYKL